MIQMFQATLDEAISSDDRKGVSDSPESVPDQLQPKGRATCVHDPWLLKMMQDNPAKLCTHLHGSVSASHASVLLDHENQNVEHDSPSSIKHSVAAVIDVR